MKELLLETWNDFMEIGGVIVNISLVESGFN